MRPPKETYDRIRVRGEILRKAVHNVLQISGFTPTVRQWSPEVVCAIRGQRYGNQHEVDDFIALLEKSRGINGQNPPQGELGRAGGGQ